MDISETPRSVTFPTFDLSFVENKLKRQPQTADWTNDERSSAIQGYRQFLVDCKEYPKTRFKPRPDVDHVWHTHILFTREYARDCNAYFGYFLHHNPTKTESNGCEDGGCDVN